MRGSAATGTRSLGSKSIEFFQACLRWIGIIALLLAMAFNDGPAEAATCATALSTARAHAEVCTFSKDVVLVSAKIRASKKTVTAAFDLADRRLSNSNGGRFWNRLWVSEGDSKITARDQAALRDLMNEGVATDPVSRESAEAVQSLLKFLVGFVEPGTRLEAFDRSASRTQRFSIPTGKYTPICEFLGKTLEATYTVTAFMKSEALVVGAPETRCRGRCGFGCENGSVFGQSQYTQECFNHDACHDATGQQLGDCADEFWAASSSYVLAPDCL